MEKRPKEKVKIQGQHYEGNFKNSLFNFQGPARDTRGYSSAGRAPALQAGGQRFDPAYLHHKNNPKKGILRKRLKNEPNQYGLIAQPVRAHA